VHLPVHLHLTDVLLLPAAQQRAARRAPSSAAGLSARPRRAPPLARPRAEHDALNPAAISHTPVPTQPARARVPCAAPGAAAPCRQRRPRRAQDAAARRRAPPDGRLPSRHASSRRRTRLQVNAPAAAPRSRARARELQARSRYSAESRQNTRAQSAVAEGRRGAGEQTADEVLLLQRFRRRQGPPRQPLLSRPSPHSVICSPPPRWASCITAARARPRDGSRRATAIDDLRLSHFSDALFGGTSAFTPGLPRGNPKRQT